MVRVGTESLVNGNYKATDRRIRMGVLGQIFKCYEVE